MNIKVKIKPADRKRFRELANRWRKETIFMSNSGRAAEHPAHMEIISMGEPAVPLILEMMQEPDGGSGHWSHALKAITGAQPVEWADRGKIAAIEAAWLAWGEANGYIQEPSNSDIEDVKPTTQRP